MSSSDRQILLLAQARGLLTPDAALRAQARAVELGNSVAEVLVAEGLLTADSVQNLVSGHAQAGSPATAADPPPTPANPPATVAEQAAIPPG